MGKAFAAAAALLAGTASAYYSDRLNDFGTLSYEARHSKVHGETPLRPHRPYRLAITMLST